MSGMTTALEAAEAGRDVVLVERNPYLGGRVAQLTNYFPKLCPPYCGLEINFKRMRTNPRIRFFTMAEVESISGSEGAFDVKIKINPRYVNEKCTCCGACSEAVETEIPNLFNYGMNTIKGAYLPHELAFPMRYVIDPEVAKGPDGKKAEEACKYGAVDLSMEPKTFDLKVSSIVWATGWTPYDAAKVEYYGFGVYKNVITNVMMERLANRNGPTGGKIVRPSDGKEVNNVAFIQCAGSRDENHLAYCSGICCMASLKQSTYVREQYPDAKIAIYFIDIRTPHKYEDFYVKIQQDEKVQFVKSKIAQIVENESTGNLTLIGEDTMSGRKLKADADLVVLATGMQPNTAVDKAPADLKYDDYGFIAAEQEVPGICGAGCVRNPLDVASSVQDGTGAALKAIQSVMRR
ncbi:MAG: CoB--CoM heterodisulfide reductase iron-sulfur subunit A family protein [Deltaproteobacteria bacterium]|nr:CoB--CoM heterodisulfide reductase iron-sulfur subunit A family protein [Deltaproteobacteria bacterium]